jgi:hypothetical protein
MDQSLASPERENIEHLYLCPPSEKEGVKVEFRLVYRGSLPAGSSANSRATEKQAIRKALHPQLKEWWAQNSKWMGDAELIANNFDRCGFRFAPVVSKKRCQNCSIYILFLRRDSPGNLITSGGDIDNRIKVLFDGLRMPTDRNETAGAVPDEDENPFFCLLEDDKLITEVHVVTDRLLTPVETGERKHDVELVIQVRSDQDVAKASETEEALRQSSFALSKLTQLPL